MQLPFLSAPVICLEFPLLSTHQLYSGESGSGIETAYESTLPAVALDMQVALDGFLSVASSMY